MMIRSSFLAIADPCSTPYRTLSLPRRPTLQKLAAVGRRRIGAPPGLCPGLAAPPRKSGKLGDTPKPPSLPNFVLASPPHPGKSGSWGTPAGPPTEALLAEDLG